MKAKDVAQKLNETAREQGVLSAWEELSARVKAGDPDNDVVPDAEAFLENAGKLVQPLGSEYLNALLVSLGEEVEDVVDTNPELVREALMRADRSWREFHSLLVPALARVVNEDAMKNALIILSPQASSLVWPSVAAPRSPRLH